MKKTKLIPPFMMLMAGAITSILTFINQYEIKDALFILLFVLIIFYFMGLIVKKIFDTYTIVNNKILEDEGEVIEKEVVKDTEGNEKNTWEKANI